MIRLRKGVITRMSKNLKDRLFFNNVGWLMKKIDVPVLLKRMGIGHYTKRGNEIRALCPDHHLFVGRRSSDPNWFLNIKTGKTNCYTESRGSNIVYTVARLNGCSSKDAVGWILDLDSDSDVNVVKFNDLKDRLDTFKDEDDNTLRGELELNDIEDEIKNGVVYERGCNFFMNPLGKKPTNITKETVNHFKVIERKWGYYKDRVIVPFFQKENLVGFCAMDVLGEERWRESNRYKKDYKKVLYPTGVKIGKCLFGYDEVKTRAESLFITEGARDVMKLWQEGFVNSVAVLGTNLSDAQMKLLSELCPQKTYIILDGDDAGKKASSKMWFKLSEFFDTYVVDLPDGYDPKNLNRKELLSVIKKSYKVRKNS